MNERHRLMRLGMLRAAAICEARGKKAHEILMTEATPGSSRAINLVTEANASDECGRQIRKAAEKLRK